MKNILSIFFIVMGFGFGYANAKDFDAIYLDRYIANTFENLAWFNDNSDDTFINSDFYTIEGVSYTGNHVYMVTHRTFKIGHDRNELIQCDTDGFDNYRCKSIDTFDSVPTGVSFDNNGTGYVVTQNGHLNRYVNNTFEARTFNFFNSPTGVSYTGNNVYVINVNKELLKCNIGGGCRVIDTFDSEPLGVSFDNNGTGYVVTKAGHLNRYVNNTFERQPFNFKEESAAVSYTGNNVYVLVYVLTSSSTSQDLDKRPVLKKCNANGEECINLNSEFRGAFPVGVSFDNNGTGFVVQKGVR